MSAYKMSNSPLQWVKARKGNVPPNAVAGGVTTQGTKITV